MFTSNMILRGWDQNNGSTAPPPTLPEPGMQMAEFLTFIIMPGEGVVVTPLVVAIMAALVKQLIAREAQNVSVKKMQVCSINSGSGENFHSKTLRLDHQERSQDKALFLLCLPWDGEQQPL